MGKKNEKEGASAPSDASGGALLSSSGFHVSATRKWSVMDAPGIDQPDWSSSTELNQLRPDQQAAPPSSGTNTKEGLQGRRATKSSGGSKISPESGIIGGDSFTVREANPSWISHRVQQFDRIAAIRQSELERKSPVPISVGLPDGHVMTQNQKTGEPFLAWKATPFDVASSISSGLAEASTVAKVTYQDFASDYRLEEDGMAGDDTLMSLVDGGESPTPGVDDAGASQQSNNDASRTFLWDMTRPLVGNVKVVEFLKFEDSQDAKSVFWHSSAHIMGEALEHLFGCKLTIGPPLAGGFYYDSYMNADAIREEDCTCAGLLFAIVRSIHDPSSPYRLVFDIAYLTHRSSFLSYVQCYLADAPVEAEVGKIVKQKQKFERLVVTKEEGLELFKDNPFKVRILETKVPDGGRTTVYRCGDLIDLCRGPHVSNTSKIKAFAATRHSATNWLGNTANDSLQRLYGISFPDKKMLKVWKENQEKVRCSLFYCRFVLPRIAWVVCD
jgi:threonyl-tRNA synthetase